MTIDPKYSIGIPEMDEQHARWITLIERFKESAEGHLQDSVGVSAAQTALDELRRYTNSHFASEEAFIAARGYPDIEAHRAAHRKLSAEIERLMSELQSQRVRSTPLKLNLFITIWLMEHIMSEDAKYAQYIRGSGRR